MRASDINSVTDFTLVKRLLELYNNYAAITNSGLSKYKTDEELNKFLHKYFNGLPTIKYELIDCTFVEFLALDMIPAVRIKNITETTPNDPKSYIDYANCLCTNAENGKLLAATFIQHIMDKEQKYEFISSRQFKIEIAVNIEKLGYTWNSIESLFADATSGGIYDYQVATDGIDISTSKTLIENLNAYADVLLKGVRSVIISDIVGKVYGILKDIFTYDESQFDRAANMYKVIKGDYTLPKYIGDSYDLGYFDINEIASKSNCLKALRDINNHHILKDVLFSTTLSYDELINLYIASSSADQICSGDTIIDFVSISNKSVSEEILYAIQTALILDRSGKIYESGDVIPTLLFGINIKNLRIVYHGLRISHKYRVTDPNNFELKFADGLEFVKSLPNYEMLDKYYKLIYMKINDITSREYMGSFSE